MPELVAQRLVAQADREERPLGAPAARRPRPAAAPSWGRRRRAGRPDPGPTITRSKPSRPPGRVVLVPDHLAGHAEHAEHVAQHVHEVVLAVEDHHASCRPAAGRAAAPPWSVSQNVESRRLRALSASSTSSSLTSSAMFDARRRRRRHQPEGAEDAAGLRVRLGDLVRRVRVAHQRRAGGDLEPAVEVDVGGADHDRAVDDRAARRRRGRGSPARRRSSRGPRSRTS